MRGCGLGQRMDSMGREGRLGLSARTLAFLRSRRRGIWDLVAGCAIGAMLVAGFRSMPVAAVVVPYPHDLWQVSFAVAGDVVSHHAGGRGAAAGGGRTPER